MPFKLGRPLVFVDLETTSADRQRARICQIGLLFLQPNGQELGWETLINPGIQIPSDATAIHNITNEMVASAPYFMQIADQLFNYLVDKDLAGFGLRQFDLPLLQSHFKECGYEWDYNKSHIIDVQQIFFSKEPRSLEGAVKFYVGQAQFNYHNALADDQATLAVLQGQKAKYEDMPDTIPELEAWSLPEGWVDPEGRLSKDVNGKVIINFGQKHKGRILEEVAIEDPGYLEWILSNDFNAVVKHHCREAMIPF